MEYLSTREIGIDMAHRVPQHGSKCNKLHGHRYKIEAVIKGPLADSGEQTGMTLDFGFIKEGMMDLIDAFFDHATTLQENDPLVEILMRSGDFHVCDDHPLVTNPRGLITLVEDSGKTSGIPAKLCLIESTPTAENLAALWYYRLLSFVNYRSEGRARLHQIIVWETPNCKSAYPHF